MGASASVHTIFSNSTTAHLLQKNATTSLALPCLCLPCQQRTASLKVRCNIAEENKPKQISLPQIPLSPPPPPPKPKVSTKFGDVLAFSGPAPERINGRLAMIGFVAAIGAELAQGNDVVAQLANGGVPWFLGTTIVLSLASLIPLFKGVSVESKSKGLMSSDAEMWNGRFAMLGLVALVFTELSLFSEMKIYHNDFYNSF